MSRLELEHINTLWFMTLGVTAISAGVLVYVLLLESALGAFSIKEFYPTMLVEDEEPNIAILNSDYTRGFSQQNGRDEVAWYENLLENWDTYLTNSPYRQSYRWIDDQTLTHAAQLQGYDVLILPAALALSEEQVQQISRFMDRGGGVLASWKMGFYLEDGSPRPYDVLNELFDVEIVGAVDRYQGTYRAYQAIYPGEVRPGLYVPVNNVLSGILENTFSPLSGYRWIAPLSGIPPRADYAEADTTTIVLADQQEEPQKAVRVNYYSWIGDRSGRKVPYVYGGFGMEQVSLYGNTVLTRGIPSGFSFFVQVFDPALRLHPVAFARPAGYWTDGAHSSDPVPLDEFTSIAYGNRGDGRFVYTGFRRDAMGVGLPSEEDIVHIDRFFANSLHYLQARPAVWLRDWPVTYNGAALLSGIGNRSLDSFVEVAEVLAEEDVESTIFIDPAQADLYRSTVSQLLEVGDIGVLDDFPRNQYMSRAVLVDRFARLRGVLENLTQSPVRSYRPAYSGSIDPSVYQALAQAGYRSVYADSVERQSTPKILKDISPQLTRYSITARTGQELIPESFGSEMDLTPVHRDMERLAREGGVYQLIYTPDDLAHPAYLDQLKEIVGLLETNRFWVATGSEITSWWREQHAVKAAIEKSGDSRLVLHLSNQNGNVVEQVGVMIDIGHTVERIRIRPELIGSPIPMHELSVQNSQLFIRVDALKPQQTRLFHIDLIYEKGAPIIADRIGGSR